MAEFSASDAAFTGFRVVAERPWIVAIWATLQFVVTLAFNLFLAYSAGPAFARLTQMSLHPPTQDPTAALDLIGQLAPTYLVLMLGTLVMNAVLYAAMNRAVLRPSESRFGYLRLAADELRQLGLFAIFVGLGIVIYMLMSIVAVTLMLILGLAPSEGLALVLVSSILLPAFVFLAVRLSLASPMTFETRRISVTAAWRMTRGRFWPLLGTYFIAFALSIVVIVLTFAIAAAVVAVIGGISALGSAFQPDNASIAAVLTPTRLAYLAISAIGQALIWPVTMTPPAAIYRALSPSSTSRVFD